MNPEGQKTKSAVVCIGGVVRRETLTTEHRGADTLAISSPHHHKQVNDEPFLLSNIDLQTQQEAPVGRVHLGVYVS